VYQASFKNIFLLEEQSSGVATSTLDASETAYMRDPSFHGWRDISNEVIAIPTTKVDDDSIDEGREGQEIPLLYDVRFKYPNDDPFRQCQEWSAVNTAKVEDPRYTPYTYKYGDYACDLQRVYECLRPSMCTQQRPVEDDGKI